MKTLLCIFTLLFLPSCTQQQSKGVPFSEDYVLVEFASKLEEDYHKFNIENPQSRNNPEYAPSTIDDEKKSHEQ